MLETANSLRIGPDSDGQPMSLDDFARSEGEPGYVYELNRGVVVVVRVPGMPHGRNVRVFMKSLEAYDTDHPGVIDYIAGGSNTAVRMPKMQTERHPDVSVYLLRPPVDSDQPWDFWTPDIVIEVVSKGGERRDYDEKRDDYLAAGVRLYWIVDPRRRTITVLTRQGDAWSEQVLDEHAALTTPLLPGFELPLARVIATQ